MADLRRTRNKPEYIAKMEARRLTKTLKPELTNHNATLMEPLVKGLESISHQQKDASVLAQTAVAPVLPPPQQDITKVHGGPTIFDPSLTPPGTFSSPFVDRPLDRFYYRNTDGVQLPYLPQSYYDIYWLANMDLIIRDSINKLTGEIFREGILVEEAFWGKCESCEEEFESKPFEAVDLTADQFQEEGLPCKTCKQGQIRPPDKDQEKFLISLLEKANNNNQTFQAIAEEVNRDFEIADDGYVILLKNYDLEEDGTITATFREMLRGDPAIMRISANNRSEIGTVQFTCLFHRNFIALNSQETCDQCGEQARFPVHYVATRLGARDIEQAYIAGEVIHDIKYNKSLLYGYPPILSMWYYALSDTNMIKYVAMYFDHRRKPNGIITIPGQWQQIMKMMRDWREEIRRDPFFIPTVAVPPDSTAKPDFIQFMDSLKEADFVALRDELRLRMSAFYGVSPIMMSDLSQGGGLNSVLGDTPIIVRKHQKWIDILPIASLHTDYDHTRSKYGLEKYEALSRSGWTPIKYSFREKKKKAIYDINTNDGFTQVTGDHSLFKDGREILGAAIQENDLLDFFSPNKERNESTTIGKELAWALGFHAADGSSQRLGRNKRTNELQGTRVCIYQKERAPLEKAKEAIDHFFSINSKLRLQTNSNGNDIYALDFSYNHIYEWFDQNCYSTFVEKEIKEGKTKVIVHREKKVPIQILNAHDGIKQAYIDGYWVGDGHIDPKGRKRCSGIYKSLIAGLRYMINQLGKQTSVSWHPNGKNYIVRLSIHKSNERTNQRNKVKRIRFYTKYTDLYDIETEDHSFVAGVGYLLHHNSEGEQFKVTDRAAERGQGQWNDVKQAIGMFSKILKELAITDWKLALQKPDEEDRVAPIDRLAKRLDNAKKWQEMGGIVQLPEDGLTDENDFLLLGEPFVKPDPATQPGFGGFGGGTTTQRPGSPSSGEQPDRNPNQNQAQETTTTPDEEEKSLQKADPLDLFGEGFTDRLIAFFRNSLLINFESISNQSIPETGMDEIKNRIEDSISQLQSQFESLSERFMTAVFSFGQSSTFDPDQKPDPSLLNFETQPDQEVIQAVESESLLEESFVNFTLATSQQFVDLIQANETNRTLTMDQLVAQMADIAEAQEYRLRRIARSEAQKIVLTGREIGFNQLQAERMDEDFFYLWLITKDRRTSPQCLEIEKRVQALADSNNNPGISIEEFKEISIVVQQEMNGSRWTPTPYLPHPSCRSSLIRIV